MLLESSTESEWVARCLEELGHEGGADPNSAALYATRSRRVKTDKRDARTLAEACKLGTYQPARRASDESRHQRAQLAVREALVRTRTRYISLVSARVRREGLRVADGRAETFVAPVVALALPGRLRAEVAPLLSLIHFGDLDPNGVRIYLHLRERRPDRRWFVPSFWAELVNTHGLHAPWPADLDLGAAPWVVRELAARGLWLEAAR